MTVVTVASLVVGVGILLFGRALFWLVVGAAGFAAGAHVAASLWRGQPEWVVLAVALGLGALGALLALVWQVAAIALGGFLAGGYATVWALGLFGWASGGGVWLAVLAGAVAGAILVLLLLDWALIGLSSVTGAALLARLAPLPPLAVAGLFLILLAAGVAFQIRRLPSRKEDRAPRT